VAANLFIYLSAELLQLFLTILFDKHYCYIILLLWRRIYLWIIFPIYLLSGIIYYPNIFIFWNYLFSQYIYFPNIFIIWNYLFSQYIYFPNIFIIWNYLLSQYIYFLELFIFPIYLLSGIIYYLELFIIWNYLLSGIIYFLELFIKTFCNEVIKDVNYKMKLYIYPPNYCKIM